MIALALIILAFLAVILAPAVLDAFRSSQINKVDCDLEVKS